MTDVTGTPAAAAAPPAEMSFQDALYTPDAAKPIDPASGEPKQEDAPAPESKAEDAPKPEGEAKPEGEEAPEGEAPDPTTLVPATADEYTFTPPDGFKSDDAALKSFRDLAHSKGMTQSEFTSAMDLFTGQLKAQVEATQSAQLATYQDTQTKWLTEVQAMPEFQGERRERSEQMIGKLLDEYGTPEVREIFAVTGAGNNPAMVKMMYKLASALNEGKPQSQGKPAPKANVITDLADVFGYNDPKPNQ